MSAVVWREELRAAKERVMTGDGAPMANVIGSVNRQYHANGSSSVVDVPVSGSGIPSDSANC